RRRPVWLGREGPRVMRLAGRYADGFDLGKHGTGGADLTNEEIAAAFKELGSMRWLRSGKSRCCVRTGRRARSRETADLWSRRSAATGAPASISTCALSPRTAPPR